MLFIWFIGSLFTIPSASRITFNTDVFPDALIPIIAVVVLMYTLEKSKMRLIQWEL